VGGLATRYLSCSADGRSRSQAVIDGSSSPKASKGIAVQDLDIHYEAQLEETADCH
jgi:hypothetical protein